jgi:HPt (histidine-containing phosphotransfer) domain-containing protein
MPELHQALAAGDAARLQRLAHSLKGAASLFGVAAVTEAAQALESLGKAKQLAGAAEGYGRLEQELGRLRAALTEWLATSPSSSST